MANDANSRPVTQHVFVDFENMKTLDLDSIGKRPIDFEVVFGPQDKKLDLDLVVKLMDYSDSVKLIRSPKAGNNAADFVLAYCLGQSVLRNPGDRFHVVSKDGGFNSLVELLTAQGVSITRHGSWNSLRSALSLKQSPAVPKVETKKTVKKVVVLSDGARKIVAHLNATPKNRPKNHKKLTSLVASHFHLPADHKDVVDPIKELVSANYIRLNKEGKTDYHLPPTAAPALSPEPLKATSAPSPPLP